LIEAPVDSTRTVERPSSASGLNRAQRLFAGWSANLFQIILGVTQQVALIPVFLHFWSGNVLAAWLAVYSVGNLVMIADGGLQFRVINRFLGFKSSADCDGRTAGFYAAMLRIYLWLAGSLTILLLIGISATFGYLISLYSVAELTGKMMETISTNPWVIFFLINLILFVLGTFLDMAATILICTPIFLPICQQFGMDPVQFGMVMLINCALGLNTPPVGTTQFVGCAIGGVSIGYVMRTIWPFYGALIAALMLVTYVPAFSLWLPKAFGYLGG